MMSRETVVLLSILCGCMMRLMVVVAAVDYAELVLPHQQPDPESVAHDVRRSVNASLSAWRAARQLQEMSATGNPIDDCWRSDPGWPSNRQHLADCAIGFGRDALGGKGGEIYVVTDASDSADPASPLPGTLRFGVTQSQPLWIIFSGDMQIELKNELLIGSFKTIDGRGANIQITGFGCLILRQVTNVIIHNVQIHHCKPSGKAEVRKSPTEVVASGGSDGDGITVYGSGRIWIDHCTLSYCTDGLIDVTEGSTGVTISNNLFSHHDKVMLLGHSDDFTADKGMQVTVAFNRFGEDLMERMPRCRFGYFHVVNNDYLPWGMYAVGGSSNPTINSQGNRYIAPDNNKEVTKRMDTDESEWKKWDWRTEGDAMMNGAFFVASGTESSPQYAEASSIEPLSAVLIEQLTSTAGAQGYVIASDPGGTPNPGSVTNPNPPPSGDGSISYPGSGWVTQPSGDGSICYPGSGGVGSDGDDAGFPFRGNNYGVSYGNYASTHSVPMNAVLTAFLVAFTVL
ncbi:hypothetical protein MLD38_014183 [Melastoma candidum]|uniref:Uncharacterized protein n=1 Tax=Melastoma candidum TaxID=119954 RepID=A0ACB9RD47_9MYRT|nr:hypothetical protein MLD38_014183 [Melastoma candidum]